MTKGVLVNERHKMKTLERSSRSDEDTKFKEFISVYSHFLEVDTSRPSLLDI